MTFQALPRHPSVFLLGDLVEAGSGRFRKTLVLSLVLHLCLLAVIMGIKLFKKVERPMSAMEVSLVSLPAVEKPESKVEKVEKAIPRPTPKPVESAPIPVPPKPAQQPTPPPVKAIAPTVKPSGPAPAPPPAPTPRLETPTLTAPQLIPQSAKSTSTAPVANRADVFRDVLKDIELPPDAPKYGDLAPMKPAEAKGLARPKPERTSERSDLDAMLKRLKVPEMASAAAPVEAAPPDAPKLAVVPPKRASLSDEMNSDLSRELQDLKKLQTLPPVKYAEPVREVKPMFRESQPMPSAPPVTASIPRSKPETKLRVAGASGSSPYWNLVKSRIVNFWVAPPVDIKALTVVVRFRLERDGTIGSVVIDQTSGNA
ncbi:MAG TPA: TonB C-terminal domain-containing protein, partial [Nitrospira sp.]|nr:TonB C-terminal domain-containing protein [Nitrospira sp.]